MLLIVSIVLTGVGSPSKPGPRLDSIVVSAQLHRLHKEKSEMGYWNEVSRPVEAAHLYVIRPRRQMRRLTRGKADDLAPRYSKPMNGLLFVRSSDKPNANSLMFLPTGSSIPKRLRKLPSGGFPEASISASGQTYVVKLFDRDHWDDDDGNLVCVYKGEVVKTFSGAGFFQMVPGTETVYVQTKGSGNLLFDCVSRHISKSWATKYPLWWLNSQKALWLGDAFELLPDFVVYGRDGQETGKIKPKGFDGKGMYTYRLLPEAELMIPDTLIVEATYHMSSGGWPGCRRLNLQTGDLKPLFEGQWLDTNDRDEFLALQWEWIGAYHRGNDRTGHLFLEWPGGKRERQLTHYPYDVSAACWAPASRW